MNRQRTERLILPTWLRQLLSGFLSKHGELSEANQREVEEAFLEGVVEQCAQWFGRNLDSFRKSRSWSCQELMQFLGAGNPAKVSRLLQGEHLRFRDIALIPPSLQMPYGEILPTLRAARASGHAKAARLVAELYEIEAATGLFDCEECECVALGAFNGKLRRAAAPDAPAELLNDAFGEIAQTAEANLGRRIARVHGPTHLRRLIHGWLLPWLVTLQYLPLRWQSSHEDQA